MPQPLRALIVEDSADDAELMLLELRRSGYAVASERVQTAEEMRQALREGRWDVVLSDHTMPGFSSMGALKILRETGLDLPFLIVSGSIGEEHAVAAMRAGCHDYIMKENLARLAPAIQRELRDAEVRRAHEHAETERHQSEERLRLLFEASLDAIIIADESGRFVQVNEAACELFGQPREQLLQTGILEIETGHGSPDPPAMLNEYRRRGEDKGEFTFRRSDGQWRVAEYSARRFSPDLHVRILRDVTERRRGEEALRQSEERFALFMRNLPGVAFIKDASGRYMFMNEVMQNTFSLRRTDWHGRTDEEIWRDAAAASGFSQSDRTVVQSKRFVEVVESIAHSDGMHDWLVSKFPLMDREGRVIMIGAVGIDITERKRAEEARQQLQGQLQQAQKLESLGVLAGGIAHDFNNLLTIIISNAQFVRDAVSLEPVHQNALQDIETAATHAADMTRALQTFSRPHTPQVRPLDANALLTEVHRLLRRLIPATIEFHLKESREPCGILADGGQIQQAIVNLCVNARDAMPGGGTLELSVGRVSPESTPARLRPRLKAREYVRISVRDTGVGMDERTLQRAFDPFFTTKPKDRGTGLGLAIVYGIIEAHDGRIDVTSAPGKGTTFDLYLPAATASAPDTARPATTPSRGRGNIVVVDDEEMIASLLKTVLESRGYSVTIARSAEEAIELARADHPIDLAIVDYSMPHMTGDLCLSEMQRHRPGLRALLITGYEVPEDMALPPDTRLVPKPFTVQGITDAVRGTLVASSA